MSLDQLGLYNAALAFVGEGPLIALTEARPSARYLDEVWARGDGWVRAVLEQGFWKFAMRTVEIYADPAVTPGFGYTNAFTYQSDLVRLAQVSADESFYDPLLNYTREAGYFYADVDPLYLSYVSDDALFGSDYGRWTSAFIDYAAAYGGVRIWKRIKSEEGYSDAKKEEARLLSIARSLSAQEDPTKFLPTGSWVRARQGRGGGERGRRDRLIG